jgi:2-polyprenyl-3-methyl-5-hydroxy-6-metoxy-1,4-benzoquinol methylase
MKKTGNLDVNTKFYWDNIYGDIDKRKQYDVESGDLDHPVTVNGIFIYPSKRFDTAVTLIKDGEKVLDIGCGTGSFVRRVLEKYPFNEVWGVDISSVVVEANKVKIPDGVFIQQRIGALDKVPENYFDVVFSGEVMEHLQDPHTLFRDAYTCLKDGGRFVTTAPLDNMVNSSEHVWYLTKDDVTNFYQDAGFNDVYFIDLPELEKELIIFAIGEKCPKK